MAWPLFFLELSKVLEKQWPTLRVFQPSPPRLVTIANFGFKRVEIRFVCLKSGSSATIMHFNSVSYYIDKISLNWRESS